VNSLFRKSERSWNTSYVAYERGVYSKDASRPAEGKNAQAQTKRKSGKNALYIDGEDGRDGCIEGGGFF
jgi:hypothetical protein